MTLAIDLQNVLTGNPANNFSVGLLRLCFKADAHNLALLRKSFPNATEMVDFYRMTGEIKEDLTYD